ncbi:hypothetical protein F8154_09310 [Alkaliphilus pronyensis]|uniref:Uncharacterized protein n=1 Tax=Alkaliphilus pronyensis TaxID=1482732 RepID=A0A6I0F0M0_9FIRM|nr:hypothetical protein [Alkaliphilus pronyensis]KAB3534125.1 hypothetical protein F8154_09310 [Alkaliphilus pronyensis]
MKKGLKRFIWILLLAALVIVLHPKKYEIDKAVVGNKISMESKEKSKPIEISIKGVYNWNWFSDDTFEGQIILEGYEITQEGLMKITFNKTRGVYPIEESYGIMDYYWEDETYESSISQAPRYDIAMFGFLSMDRRADDIIILIYPNWPMDREDWDEFRLGPVNRGTVVTYPKRDFEEIKERVNIRKEEP